MASIPPIGIPPRATLTAVGCVIALLLAEAILRIIPPLGPAFILAGTNGAMDNQIFQDDIRLRVVLAPNVQGDGFTTNALGLRGAEIPSKKANSHRVLAVGDSFTLGLQVTDEETFSARLNTALGPNIEVFNAGVPGYGTEQATEMMRRIVPRVQADAVLLTVYTGNDFRDNLNWAKSPGLPTTPPPVQAPPPRPPRWISVLSKYSRIAANYLMFSALKNQESDFRMAEFKDEILPFADRDHLEQIQSYTQTALGRFAAACSELNVKCGIAIVPPAFVAHPERVEKTFRAFGLDPKTADLNAPQTMVQQNTPPTVSVLDLTPMLQQRADERPYLVFDPHFSANGHEITASALQPFIRALVEPQ